MHKKMLLAFNVFHATTLVRHLRKVGPVLWFLGNTCKVGMSKRRVFQAWEEVACKGVNEEEKLREIWINSQRSYVKYHCGSGENGSRKIGEAVQQYLGLVLQLGFTESVLGKLQEIKDRPDQIISYISPNIIIIVEKKICSRKEGMDQRGKMKVVEKNHDIN